MHFPLRVQSFYTSVEDEPKVTAILTAKPADNSKQSHILADNNIRKEARGGNQQTSANKRCRVVHLARFGEMAEKWCASSRARDVSAILVYKPFRTMTAKSTAALPHENLPFSSSSRHFPTTLLWSFLQDRNFAHLLGSSRRTWHSLERKGKIFHEAGLHLAVASAHSSHDAGFKRREEWSCR
jgi:hypothetical protein